MKGSAEDEPKLTGLPENGKGKTGARRGDGGGGEKGPHRDGRHTKVTRETHGGTRFIVSATRVNVRSTYHSFIIRYSES
jgi:hypothetical protein